MKRGFLNTSKAQKALFSAKETAKPAENSIPKDAPVLKFSTGVVEDKSLPENYKLSIPELKEFSHQTNDYADNHYIISTQPAAPLGSTFSDYPKCGGWTECLISGFTKRHILSVPGFPKPLVQPTSVCHKVQQISGKGLGIFATRDIECGSVVFSERPLMIAPSGYKVPVPAGFDPRSGNVEQYKQAALQAWEKTLGTVFNRLCPEAKTAFMALHSGHEHDGSGPLAARIRTNGYGCCLKDIPENMPPGKTTSYTAICDQGSRFNHSCIPNICQCWDTPTFSFQFRAARDIKAGEELVVQYCDIVEDTASRQSELEGYGFQCTCKACLKPSRSDARRSAYKDKIIRIGTEEFAKWRKDLSLPDDYILKRCFEQIRICDEEGLHNEFATLACYDLIVAVYALLADGTNVAKYGKKVAQLEQLKDEDEVVIWGDRQGSLEWYKKQECWDARARMKREGRDSPPWNCHIAIPHMSRLTGITR